MGEAQVRGAELGQPAPRAQPGEWQRRARAAGDDQVHRRWPVVQEKGEGVVDGLRAYGVVVVEHEGEVTRHLEYLVAERGEDGLELLPRLQGAQEGTRGRPEVLVYGLYSRDQVQEEACRIVVPLVQRDPGHRKLAALAPVREQSRLAETGRRGDDGQLVLSAVIQPLVQARTRYGIRTITGYVELGPEDLPVHEWHFYHRENYTRRPAKPSVVPTARLTRVRVAPPPFQGIVRLGDASRSP
jgi:hypothetical protein